MIQKKNNVLLRLPEITGKNQTDHHGKFVLSEELGKTLITSLYTKINYDDFCEIPRPFLKKAIAHIMMEERSSQATPSKIHVHTDFHHIQGHTEQKTWFIT